MEFFWIKCFVFVCVFFFLHAGKKDLNKTFSKLLSRRKQYETQGLTRHLDSGIVPSETHELAMN